MSSDTHISIGGVVIEQFEDPVERLIDASLNLSARECDHMHVYTASRY